MTGIATEIGIEIVTETAIVEDARLRIVDGREVAVVAVAGIDVARFIYVLVYALILRKNKLV